MALRIASTSREHRARASSIIADSEPAGGAAPCRCPWTRLVGGAGAATVHAASAPSPSPSAGLVAGSVLHRPLVCGRLVLLLLLPTLLRRPLPPLALLSVSGVSGDGVGAAAAEDRRGGTAGGSGGAAAASAPLTGPHGGCGAPPAVSFDSKNS